MTILDVIKKIDEKRNEKLLILVRGIPGSGKSTIAKLLSLQFGFNHIETDMFFINKKGVYSFEKERLREAHSWCQQKTEKWLNSGNNVIVSNTFVKKWEINIYEQLAKNYGYELFIIEATGNFVNVHGVPKETVDRMKNDFESKHSHYVLSSGN